MKLQKEFSIISKETMPSTNDYAKIMVESGPVEDGTLIYTPHQTKGRGQRSTKWYSEPGDSLTFSMIFQPNFLKASYQFYLTKAVSVGLLQGLFNITGIEDFTIKWPNDLYYKNLKLGGVLIENSLSKDLISYCVVGVGINLNQKEFPNSLPNPVSLRQIADLCYDSRETMLPLAEAIWNYYILLKNGHFGNINQQYEQSLFLLNQFHQFQLSEGWGISGKIKGVDEQGFLKLEDGNGKLHKFDLKSIQF